MPSFSQLFGNFDGFSSFAEHFILAAFLFLLIAALILYLFARDRMFQVLFGVLRTIASFFTGPFIFLKKLVGQIADFGTRGDSDFRTTEQYLIHLSLTMARVAVIAVAIAGLAGSIVAGIEASWPRSLLAEIDNVKEQMAKDKVELGTATDKLEKYDKDWQSKRDQLVNQYRSEATQKSDAAQRENNQIESSANADATLARALEPIRRFLTENQNASDALSVARVHDNAIQFAERLALSDYAKAQIVKYADNWQTIMNGRLQVNSISEDQLRARIQPDYRQLSMERDSLTAQVAREEEVLSSLRKRVSYSPLPLMSSIFFGVLYFILTVWFCGLILEWISLSVSVARDIRDIRDVAKNPAPAAKSEAAVAR